ncbi:MAG: CGNR zinc finger domain-containing protein [Acidimicrobiales bacterium]
MATTVPSWVPDIEAKPAPMPLLVVQSFVNTWESDTGVDLLADPEAGPRWLEAAGLLRTADVDLTGVRAFREAIRGLLVANSGEAGVGPGDLAVLRAQAARVCPGFVVLDDGALQLLPRPDDGLGFLAATVLLVIRDAQRDGTWARLKACRNPECHWAFYDRSHAGRGAWCDMAVCGNRIKNRKLRTRRSAAREGSPGAPPS